MLWQGSYFRDSGFIEIFPISWGFLEDSKVTLAADGDSEPGSSRVCVSCMKYVSVFCCSSCKCSRLGIKAAGKRSVGLLHGKLKDQKCGISPNVGPRNLLLVL